MNIKMEELLPIVAELADKYTGKESTSITYEKAGQLMGAVLYCINEYKAHVTGRQDLLIREDEPEAKQLYAQGYELVLKKVKETNLLYNKMIPDFRFYENRCYYDTFAKGIPAFFLYYDPRFNPRNHILTLDYPVLIPIDSLCGIDAIHAYVKCALLEQKFLGKLPDAYIRHVLKAYSPDYEELLINLAGIVLKNILGCRIAKKAVDTKGYALREKVRLKDYVNQNSPESLEQSLKGMIDDLVALGYGGDKELGDYLKAAVHNYSFELKHAIENQCLDSLLAV